MHSTNYAVDVDDVDDDCDCGIMPSHTRAECPDDGDGGWSGVLRPGVTL